MPHSLAHSLDWKAGSVQYSYCNRKGTLDHSSLPEKSEADDLYNDLHFDRLNHCVILTSLAPALLVLTVLCMVRKQEVAVQRPSRDKMNCWLERT